MQLHVLLLQPVTRGLQQPAKQMKRVDSSPQMPSTPALGPTPASSLVCSPSGLEALSWLSLPSLVLWGRDRAASRLPPTLANTDCVRKGRARGFRSFHMRKLKPRVTCGLQKRAWKRSLGYKVFTRDEHLSTEEGGSRTWQRETEPATVTWLSPGQRSGEPWGKYCPRERTSIGVSRPGLRPLPGSDVGFPGKGMTSGKAAVCS